MKLDSVRLDVMLILMQDMCTVCAENTIYSEVIWTHPMEQLGDVHNVESFLVHLETVLVLVQDRCKVCAKRTISSEIISDAPGNPDAR